MDAQRLRELASRVRASRVPTLKERCINGGRRLHEECGANHRETIGPVMDIYRSLGHPDTQDFIEGYFAHASGRTPEQLAKVVTDLVKYCRSNATSGCRYDEDEVASWFLYLIFVRTVTGGRAEKALFELLSGRVHGWRYTTSEEDRQLELDLVNERLQHAVQVKPKSWKGSIPSWIRTAGGFSPKCRLWLVYYTGKVEFSFTYLLVEASGAWHQISSSEALAKLTKQAAMP